MLHVRMPTIRKVRREVPINYQSERINKQISSLPDILIKLKTEINSVLEAPLVVEYISITNWATINLHPCRVSFSLDFSPGIAHSKPTTAFTCAELRLLVSAKVRNNVRLSDRQYLTFYRPPSNFISFDQRIDILVKTVINSIYSLCYVS